ncbi:N-formylglutamate amidohydrolase, partial [Candidatus Saccharibacteria bacterium]|nr:N-formylglutamate amidohydrolase [Candidatus Saccharibacteria bacterium]
NRAPDEIYIEVKQRGDGVVMLQQANGIDLYEEDPTMEEMQEWIESYHRPFHSRLKHAMKNAAFLIDGHSLLPYIPEWRKSFETGERADISLGNREYCSCSAETMQFFREHYEALGYSVTLNDPYPGRYILGVYANRLSTPGIQIEINRKLYMNNDTFEPFDDVIERMNTEFNNIVRDFVEWFEPKTDSRDRPMTDLSGN